jgi:acyl-CoA reductase-like NAD-dependent aldehyde dehydrogenase
MDVLDPATGQIITTVETDDAESVAARYRAARQAQPDWRATPLGERLDLIHTFRYDIDERAPALAALLTSETGKPITQSAAELTAVLDRIDFFLDHTSEVLAVETVFRDDGAGLEEMISHDPIGVIANVSAWNYPWFVGLNVIVPALLTGNTVLYKPSEHATLTGLALRDLLYAAGVPESVFAALVGGPDTGAAVVRQPLDGVFFTGSRRAGDAIAQVVPGRLTLLQLELGGKDPAYVTDDADLVAAVGAIASGAFYNAGQSCCAVERLYVHDSIHDRFVTLFVEAVEALVVGDPSDPATTLGPLARRPQLDVLEHQVADAVEKGARVLTGGARRPEPGWWFEPTVLVDVDHEMAVMKDESFGPIIGIQRVGSDDEAVTAMNDTDYGLTAAVFGPDRRRAEGILSQLEVGSAYWNCCDRVSPRLPWSGRRASGTGTTLGLPGIASFLRPRAWHLHTAP